MNEETTTPSDTNDQSEKQSDVSTLPERDEKGRLLPGNTANPKGRPKKKRFEDYYTEKEKEDLINKIKTSENESNWMKEAEMIFGKAKQPLVGGDESDNAIQLEISEKIAGKRKLYAPDGIPESNS